MRGPDQNLPVKTLVDQIHSTLYNAARLLGKGAIVLLSGGYNSTESYIECRVFPLFADHIPKEFQANHLAFSYSKRHLHDCIFHKGIMNALRGRSDELSADIPRDKIVTYGFEDQDWEFNFSEGSEYPELFFLDSGSHKYFVTPITFLGQPILYLVSSDEEDEWKKGIFNNHYNVLQNVLASYVTLATIDIVRSNDFLNLKSKEELIEEFTQRTSSIILPFSYTINGIESALIGFPEVRFEKKIRFVLNNEVEIQMILSSPFRLNPSLTTSILQDKNVKMAEMQLQAQIQSLEKQFLLLYKMLESRWLGSDKNGNQTYLESLDDGMKTLENLQAPINQILSSLGMIKEQIVSAKRTTSLGSSVLLGSNDYSFLPLSFGWHIVYKGRRVKCKGNPQKGLQYIHKILSRYPHPISAFTFEYLVKDDIVVSETIDLSSPSGQFQLSIDPEKLRSIPENEVEILESIKRLRLGLLDQDLENELLIHSNMVYYAHILKQFGRRYYVVFNRCKKDLEDKIFELHIRFGNDKSKVHQILGKLRIIEAAPKGNHEIKKQRWRISKIIDYAINQMEDPGIKLHFKESISKGRVFKYEPSQKIDWYLGEDLDT